MTYRQLYTKMNQLFTDEQLDADITIHDVKNDEYHPAVLDFANSDKQSVLDDNHPIIRAK